MATDKYRMKKRDWEGGQRRSGASPHADRRLRRLKTRQAKRAFYQKEQNA